ncbi:MAG: inorganic diphosphatase [Rickettsiales bacterium]|nr:inorganic diphosphatase [Rickettsiales bacterium]
MNPWHDVSPGDNPPELVNAIIEIPRRSRAKYELDKETGLLKLDRILYSAVHYPANYGLIPQTLGEDNDPLDIMVLSYTDAPPLCLMRARIIGVMRMIDGGEGDDKLIAVAEDDVSVSHIRDVNELPAQFTTELLHFFSEYKRLENKEVQVDGFQDKIVAQRIINEGIERYKETFPK